MGNPEKKRRDVSKGSNPKRKVQKPLLASKALRTKSLISNNSKKAPDKNRRRRAIILTSKNPFINFFRDYKKKHPHMSIVDLASKVAKLWNVMNNRQREKFSLIKGAAARAKSRKATGAKNRKRSKSKQNKKDKANKKKEDEDDDEDDNDEEDNDEEDDEEKSATADSASEKEEEYVSSVDE